jgi:hypothetical protein
VKTHLIIPIVPEVIYDDLKQPSVFIDKCSDTLLLASIAELKRM